MVSPFMYFVSHWWQFFMMFFALYLIVFSISAYKNFMNWG